MMGSGRLSTYIRLEIVNDNPPPPYLNGVGIPSSLQLSCFDNEIWESDVISVNYIYIYIYIYIYRNK